MSSSGLNKYQQLKLRQQQQQQQQEQQPALRQSQLSITQLQLLESAQRDTAALSNNLAVIEEEIHERANDQYEWLDEHRRRQNEIRQEESAVNDGAIIRQDEVDRLASQLESSSFLQDAGTMSRGQQFFWSDSVQMEEEAYASIPFGRSSNQSAAQQQAAEAAVPFVLVPQNNVNHIFGIELHGQENGEEEVAIQPTIELRRAQNNLPFALNNPNPIDQEAGIFGIQFQPQPQVLPYTFAQHNPFELTQANNNLQAQGGGGGGVGIFDGAIQHQPVAETSVYTFTNGCAADGARATTGFRLTPTGYGDVQDANNIFEMIAQSNRRSAANLETVTLSKSSAQQLNFQPQSTVQTSVIFPSNVKTTFQQVFLMPCDIEGSTKTQEMKCIVSIAPKEWFVEEVKKQQQQQQYNQQHFITLDYFQEKQLDYSAWTRVGDNNIFG